MPDQFKQPIPALGGKNLYRGTHRQRLANFQQGRLRRTSLELVRLGQQYVTGYTRAFTPVQHVHVEGTQGMADVHHQHHTAQARTPDEILLQNAPPMRFELRRNLGIAITWQVGDSAVFIDVKNDNLLRAPGCLAGARE